jgi:hypothetical protein
MVIQIGELAHEIGGDDLVIGDTLLEGGKLELLKGDKGIGGEAVVVEDVTGIGFGDREVWWIDFAPIIVGLAPKDRAPGLVERINALVSGFQPRAVSWQPNSLSICQPTPAGCPP